MDQILSDGQKKISSSSGSLTPLMKQYWEIKTLHQDKILMFRMGDFFEMFFDDAVRAAPILGIALTQRNKKSQDETPMCGMPHHSISGPINKLLSRGFKVAICDQIEDPKLAKGLVKRAVTRILTPGMVYDPDTLDSRLPHYLVSFDEESISFVDATTGEAFFIKIRSVLEIKKYLQVLSVAEIILSRDQESLLNQVLEGVHQNKESVSWHNDIYDNDFHHNDLKKSNDSSLPISARRILSYIRSVSGQEALVNLRSFEYRDVSRKMSLSGTVLRHLEIFSTYKGEEFNSFFSAIDRTKTSSGCRMLRQWVSFPLCDLKEIENRQQAISDWCSDVIRLEKLRSILGKMGDVERRLSKISQPQSNGRDLLALSSSIRAGLEAIEIGFGRKNFEIKDLQVDEINRIHLNIERNLLEDQPISTKQGYLIKKGVLSELDELIELSTNSQALLLKMESEEREKTGISSLKIRYNNVFGYYIEVTHVHKDKVPSHYQRKQTLTTAERYCTESLLDLEQKILSAQAKRADLEYEIFESLKKEVLNSTSPLLELATLCAELDVKSSLAWLALEKNYVRPKLTDGPQSKVVIEASRHPVIEPILRGDFVPNDIQLAPHSCLLLTGPNMAGKSTLMRQVALTAILAQLGSFVPADRAELPIFDSIYTRIGASDMLTEGLSTFMVEMTETAQMLKQATDRSLVILDEIGRGTSTYDGLALAQSILEHLLIKVRSLTLFATHYHELTRLEEEFFQISNAHMSIVESEGKIRFLHTLVKGPAMKSYGIHVAELAGLPSIITKRAKGILRELEKNKNYATSQLSFEEVVETNSLSDEEKGVLNSLKKFPVHNISPMQALNQIYEWKTEIGEAP